MSSLLSSPDPLVQLESIFSAEAYIKQQPDIINSQIQSSFFKDLNYSILENLHSHFFTIALGLIRSKDYETIKTAEPTGKCTLSVC